MLQVRLHERLVAAPRGQLTAPSHGRLKGDLLTKVTAHPYVDQNDVLQVRLYEWLTAPSCK